MLRLGLPVRACFSSTRAGLAAILGISLSVPSLLLTTLPANAVGQSSLRNPVSFSCRDSEAVIRRKSGPVVSFGRSRIYAGYQQVSRDNQNPIVVRFDQGRRTWCRTDYESTEDDGKGYGLLWNGSNDLYTVFTATGTQGTASQDYRRFSTRGWLRSYGNGGGSQVSVIVRLNPNTGNPTAGTFLTAVLSSGRTNSLVVRDLEWADGQVIVTADAWYSPRRIDRQPMTCTGASPFVYTLTLGANLSQVSAAAAERCS